MKFIQDDYRGLISSQTGIILPLVLVFLALGMLLISPTIAHGYSALTGTTVVESRAELVHAADSGVEDGLYWLTRGRKADVGYALAEDAVDWSTGPWVKNSPPYVLNDKNVTITISRSEDEQAQQHLYLIESRAETPAGEPSTVMALVYAVPFVNVYDSYPEINQHNIPTEDLYVDNAGGDPLVISGNPTVPVNITVSGDVIIDNNATLQGNLNVGGNLTLTNNIDINASIICVGGTLRLGNNSELEGVVLGDETEPLTVYLTGTHNLVWLENRAQIYGDIYTRGDMTLRLDHPNSRVYGTVYTRADYNYERHASSHQNAVFPPEENHDQLHYPCYPIPTNEAEILYWQLT